ncbi:MAG TPA: hypothetical protein VMW04_03175 [Patescibacteria group bacterium]|nr:hypothetical protein [Patescibacteria group bacterium]
MVEEGLPAASPIEVIPSKELRILYSWNAPSRPFKKRDREFWATVVAIVFLVALILFFVKEWFLIAAIIALTFVYYVLSTVEPEMTSYKLTNRGLVYAGETHPWENISQFWLAEKYGQRVINFELRSGLLGRLTLLVGEGEEAEIRGILLKYLTEEEAKPSFLDRAADWLQKKVPLESEKKEGLPTPPSAA